RTWTPHRPDSGPPCAAATTATAPRRRRRLVVQRAPPSPAAAAATRDRRPPGANCSEAPNPSPGRALDVARHLESRAPPTPDDQGAASTRGAGLGPDLLAACRRPVHITLDVYRRARKGT